ncbi:MAG: DNA primase [Epsilonproteobacteria bacterium]|nr:DNA primase [Campylobacterota bacterium]NPA64285.1 DNA primase [Campylobacterota bacterium]
MIEHSSIEQLKNVVDIVDVIGNYIELKKAGANYKALCPFHDEDTPSFVVSPQKQIFHCFGCGAGGDAIKFVMEYEKLSYPEAVEKLARMYNFTLRYTKSKGQGENLFKALESINTLYKKKLHECQEALEYLKSRGVSNASIEKFELGYAPSSQEQIAWLKQHFIPLPGAVEAGILAQDGERLYARMHERITFPIYSHTGKLIAFGGRTITDHPAKYLNTPDTKLFHKSRVLYGYHLAKSQIYAKKELILCEGYLDVVMLHQAGFSNAVATLGTALTPMHLPLLSRGEPRVIVAYDGDKAGIQAALKAAKLLSAREFEGGVVLFEEGLDPADMVKNKQTQKLQKLLTQPKPFVEFILETIVRSYDITDPRAKQKALDEGVEYLRTLPPILQEEYRHFLAALLEILPSKIRLEPKSKKEQEPLEIKDTKELSIIKTMLLYPHTIDTIADIVTPEHFRFHAREFQAALEGREDPALRALLLDEDILPIDPRALKEELLVFLIKYFQQKIHDLVKADMDFKKKSFLIRKYKENILRLKRGELVLE